MIRFKNVRRQPPTASLISALVVLHLAFPQTAAAQPAVIQTESTPEEVGMVLPTYGAQTETHLPTASRITARRSLYVTVTAYSSTVEETDGDPFTTASGSRVHDGTIAHNSLPFGTRVRFPDSFGDKIFTVEDRMNPRYGPYMADIWFPSKAEALQWGKRSVRMEIL